MRKSNAAPLNSSSAPIIAHATNSPTAIVTSSLQISSTTDLPPTSSVVRFYTDCLSSTEILAARDFYNQSMMNDGSIDENFIDFNQLPTAPEYAIDPTTGFDSIDPRTLTELALKSKRKVSIHQSFENDIEVDTTENNNNNNNNTSNYDAYPEKAYSTGRLIDENVPIPISRGLQRSPEMNDIRDETQQKQRLSSPHRSKEVANLTQLSAYDDWEDQ